MKNLLLNKNSKEIAVDHNITTKVINFHRKIDGYKPTPLVRAKKITNKLNVGNVWVKDESFRFGLPSFKILGSSWALYRLFEEKFNINFNDWNNLEDLRKIISDINDITLVTATDGNHGRGVARIASWFDFDAKIFLPKGTAKARIEDIRSEGADTIIIDGDYDKAVEIATNERNENSWLIQDTTSEEGEKITKWIVEGYSTIFWEIEKQLNQIGEEELDLIIIQIGVGSLASSVIQFYRNKNQNKIPKIIGVEPEGAACAMEAIKAGKIVKIQQPHTIMAGMNCGTISKQSWPFLQDGIDAFLCINDECACEGMKILAQDGITSGETGSAGIGGLLEIFSIEQGNILRDQFEINKTSNILAISTEGITDPVLYHKIIG